MFNFFRKADKQFLAMTAQDFNSIEDSDSAVPADLDEKMARIQFLFDKIMNRPNGGLKSFLSTSDQQTINNYYSIGDLNYDGKFSKMEFRRLGDVFGMPLTDAEVNNFFTRADTDIDGLVS